ncbi:hypothetical protein Y032_0006g2987 [Ancylostoma ceylanicum]|uniref:Uncharacterized protein n=1 Tax=Ancylostoma ceylanicum TaxID=53326 RepID=A0A016VPX6_9BILA|nr:hypothetical protein Y032_0006g2987 [Ancylostoma ceylanicum]
MDPPWRGSGVIHRVRVCPGQAVRKTPFTSSRWPSRDENLRMPVRLGQVVVKRQDTGPRCPISEENLRIRVHVRKAVRTTPRLRSADGGARKRQNTGPPMKDRSVIVGY